ncbi:hypothetical protein [Staphylococcus caledonicus]|uniref:hypothetical protein n=1 Tax=Staphylococcus caledonicus TaxID=2741333 RepID=UPI0018E413B2|nr:hypothetical protein [Staphylococcus caledonicus]MBI5973938.1 hypothetical protein [Staphylococcus caledonicus]
MLDPIIERIQSLGPEVKAVIAAIVVLAGIIFVAKPIVNSLKAFGDAKWLQGLMWGGAALVVVAIATGALAIVFGWGKEVGNGMEGELSFIMMQILNY